MTIQFTNLRTRGNEPPFPPIIIPRNIDKAFNALVSCELAFGCQIKDITPTRIETVTYVMSCVDTTIIEGTEEEMKLLVEIAILYLEIQGNKEKRYNDAVIDQVMKITQGIPLLVKMGGDMIMGGMHVRAALACMLGDYTYVAQIMKMKMDDLCTVVVMVRNEGVSVKDAMDLATSTPTFDESGKVNGLASVL